jgi:hypothetical protein
MCPDLFKTDVYIPGNEVDDDIDVLEIRSNVSDVCPPGCPNSITELFEEAVLFLKLVSQRAQGKCVVILLGSWNHWTLVRMLLLLLVQLFIL